MFESNYYSQKVVSLFTIVRKIDKIWGKIGIIVSFRRSFTSVRLRQNVELRSSFVNVV